MDNFNSMQSTGLHGLECATPEERKEIEGCNLRDYMDWNLLFVSISLPPFGCNLQDCMDWNNLEQYNEFKCEYRE